MTIELTEWASEILQRTHEAARRLNPDATVRLGRTGDRVKCALADDRAPGDALVHGDGFELLVEGALEGIVDVVEPHDQPSFGRRARPTGACARRPEGQARQVSGRRR